MSYTDIDYSWSSELQHFRHYYIWIIRKLFPQKSYSLKIFFESLRDMAWHGVLLCYVTSNFISLYLKSTRNNDVSYNIFLYWSLISHWNLLLKSDAAITMFHLIKLHIIAWHKKGRIKVSMSLEKNKTTFLQHFILFKIYLEFSLNRWRVYKALLCIIQAVYKVR